MYSFTLPSNLGARRGLVVNATPRPIYTRYPLYRRLGGPQGRYVRVRKISSPPGFDPLTVQPVASRYTDCTIPAHLRWKTNMNINTWHRWGYFTLYKNITLKAAFLPTSTNTDHHFKVPEGTENYL